MFYLALFVTLLNQFNMEFKMTFKYQRAVLSFALLFTAMAAQAGGMYAGVNVGQFTYKDKEWLVTNAVVYATGGYKFNDYFGVEARVGAGGAATGSYVDATFGTINVESKMSSYYGVYGKGVFPITSSISAFGVVGYSVKNYDNSQTGAGITTTNNTYTSSGVGYGAGAEFAVSDKISIKAEYDVLSDKISAVVLGATLKF